MSSNAAGIGNWQSYELPTVAILVLLGMVSANWLPGAIIGALFFWIVNLLITKRFYHHNVLEWGVDLLLVTSFVTLLVTVSPETTITQVFRLLGGIVLFYALVHWADSPVRLRWLMVGISISGLLLALGSLVMVDWPLTKRLLPASIYQNMLMLVSDVVTPNVLAGSLILLIPIPLSMMLFGWRRQHWIENSLAILSAVGMIGILVLSQSRSTWLAFAACFVILIALRWRWGWLSIVLAGVVAVFLVYHFGIDCLLEAILTSGVAKGVDGRIEIWKRSVMIIRDFPYTGIGMGNYGYVTSNFYPFFNSAQIPHTHNLFLQIAVDLGIPGLIGWMWVLITSVIAAWRTYWLGKRSGQMWMAGVGAGLLLSQLAMVIHGLFDAVTWGMVKPAPLVWLLWGLAIASANLIVKEQQTKQSPIQQS